MSHEYYTANLIPQWKVFESLTLESATLKCCHSKVYFTRSNMDAIVMPCPILSNMTPVRCPYLVYSRYVRMRSWAGLESMPGSWYDLWWALHKREVNSWQCHCFEELSSYNSNVAAKGLVLFLLKTSKRTFEHKSGCFSHWKESSRQLWCRQP